MAVKTLLAACGLLAATALAGLPALTLAQEATPVPSATASATATQPEKPRVFIGSSVEGLPVADALAFNLEFEAEVTVWDQDVFNPSQGTLATLDDIADRTDFAVFVLTADDVQTSRGQTSRVPRDNVLFELGFLMGRLGPSRAFMVYDRSDRPTLPSDLNGITAATYDGSRADGNLSAALGYAATQISQAMAIEMAKDAGE